MLRNKDLVHLFMESWWAVVWMSVKLHIDGHAVKNRNNCFIKETKEKIHNTKCHNDQHDEDAGITTATSCLSEIFIQILTIKNCHECTNVKDENHTCSKNNISLCHLIGNVELSDML